MGDPAFCHLPPDAVCFYDADFVECCAACPYSPESWFYYNSEEVDHGTVSL